MASDRITDAATANPPARHGRTPPPSAPRICAPIMRSSPVLLVPLSRCLGQVMMPGSHQDGLVLDEVGDLDAVLLDGDQGAVAAVGRRPLRAAHRSGGVAPAAAEASAGARPKRLEGSA